MIELGSWIQFFQSVFSPILPLLPSIITIAVGGLLTSWLWRFIRRPILELSDQRIDKLPNRNDSEGMVYRIHVTNSGRSAAENCKPEISFKSVHNGVTYQVKSSPRWAEPDQGNRLKINVDETAAFELLIRDLDGLVSFPSATETTRFAPIYEFKQGENKEAAHINTAVDPEVFAEEHCYETSIRVTSENTKSISRPIAISPNESPLVDIKSQTLFEKGSRVLS